MQTVLSLKLLLIDVVGGAVTPATKGMPLADCATRCFHDTSCSSIFYMQGTRDCILNTVSYSAVNGTRKLKTRRGALYYEWQHGECDGNSGWMFLRASGQCFRFLPDRVNFQTARLNCSRDGSLLTADTMRTINQSQLLASAFSTKIWLGGYKNDSEWIWDSGVPFSREVFWKNKSMGGGGCMSQPLRSRAWNSEACSNKRFYICERSIPKTISYCSY